MHENIMKHMLISQDFFFSANVTFFDSITVFKGPKTFPVVCDLLDKD